MLSSLFHAFLLAGVVWSGAPAAHLSLNCRPLGVSPDGEARWLVRALFTDQRGRGTELQKGGDVEFRARDASAQWQTRVRFGAPSAVIATTSRAPIAVDVWSDASIGGFSAHMTIDPRRERAPQVTASALGPHLAQVGWYPRSVRATLTVTRTGPDGVKVVGLLAPPSSTYRDVTAQPGARYRYAVASRDRTLGEAEVVMPFEPDPAAIDAVTGKGMWLSFSPDPRDDDAYTKLDPRSIVAQAVRAGIHFIELRTAYGAYWEITPAVKPRIDELIDLASDDGITVVGWTVPREPSFEDLSQSVKTALYVTPRGRHFTALAIDAERGEEFMGSGARGYAAIEDYVRLLRAALGPGYPLIATIEDPFIEHLTNATYPYRTIAANVDVLQPMVYWRALPKHPIRPADVRAALHASYVATEREAGRCLPISMGGQTAPLGSLGAPNAGEIAASLDEARELGMLGEVFFDWNETSASQWRALGANTWTGREAISCSALKEGAL